MTEKKSFSTALTKINNLYFPMIEEQLTGNGINMDDYSKQCVMNAISAINMTLDEKGVRWNDPQLDQNNVTQILLSVASLKLNPSANPREVYFQIRNVKTKELDEKGKPKWKKQIEMGVEGDGNDAILSRFGRDVKQVMQYWLVREDDEFTYPSFSGLEMEPPKWTPKGTGKVVRVVYPIIKENNIVEFHISERHDVIKNLIAHVKNNLMNETFGIAESRYKATGEQRSKIEKRKSEIIERLEEMPIDDVLKDEEMKKYISPAWKDAQSRESMLIRKMRNNIVKKIPKDFGSALIAMTYDDTTNEVNKQVQKEIDENANSEILDFEEVEEKPVPEEKEPKPEEAVNEPEPAEEKEEKKPEQVTVDDFENMVENMDLNSEDVPF